jgi:hypothetical protein
MTDDYIPIALKKLFIDLTYDLPKVDKKKKELVLYFVELCGYKTTLVYMFKKLEVLKETLTLYDLLEVFGLEQYEENLSNYTHLYNLVKHKKLYRCMSQVFFILSYLLLPHYNQKIVSDWLDIINEFGFNKTFLSLAQQKSNKDLDDILVKIGLKSSI